MATKLPPPNEIARHYNRLMNDLGGEYIHERWGNSETKRRHYRQTELGIRHGLGHVSRIGDMLEIGSGPAVWTTLYLERAASAVLLDISEGMLEQARSRLERWESGRLGGKVKYVCGDFLEVPQAARSYDTIFSSRAFEYMSDKPAFVRKCFELLRPGGTLVLVTKNDGWRDLRETRHQLEEVPRDQIPVGEAMQLDLATPDSVLEMLATAGFSDAAAYPIVFGSYHRPFGWRPVLTLLDVVHSLYHRKQVSRTPRALRFLTESFLAVARKAA